jgi:3D (Asp-Asp-Asp) domain-containing protein/LysM repeat protein
MKKHVYSMLAAATMSCVIGTSVNAQEVEVNKGDSLWKLAQIHNTSVENIKNLNHLSTNLIHPGDVLTIDTDKQYTVKQGDTLWNIARNYRVSVQALMEWNHLSTSLIHPGLNLVIHDGATTPVAAPHVTANTQPHISAPAPVKPVQHVEAPKPGTQNTAAPAAAPAAAAAPSNVSKEITVKATAYTASCEGCSGVTATGINLNENPNAKVISVDPSVIPLGTKVYVEGYGMAVAADTGGAIKGDRIDVYMPSESQAVQFGAKEVTVKILN